MTGFHHSFFEIKAHILAEKSPKNPPKSSTLTPIQNTKTPNFRFSSLIAMLSRPPLLSFCLLEAQYGRYRHSGSETLRTMVPRTFEKYGIRIAQCHFSKVAGRTNL